MKATLFILFLVNYNGGFETAPYTGKSSAITQEECEAKRKAGNEYLKEQSNVMRMVCVPFVFEPIE